MPCGVGFPGCGRWPYPGYGFHAVISGQNAVQPVSEGRIAPFTLGASSDSRMVIAAAVSSRSAGCRYWLNCRRASSA